MKSAKKSYDSILEPHLRDVVVPSSGSSLTAEDRRRLADLYMRWASQLLKSAALMECGAGVLVHIGLKSGGKRARYSLN
jgi:hypothetical protein